MTVEGMICAAVWLLAALGALNTWLLWRAGRPAAGGEAPVKEREEPGKDPVNEGFENLMTFSVRGKTGFEGEE